MKNKIFAIVCCVLLQNCIEARKFDIRWVKIFGSIAATAFQIDVFLPFSPFAFKFRNNYDTSLRRRIHYEINLKKCTYSDRRLANDKSYHSNFLCSDLFSNSLFFISERSNLAMFVYVCVCADQTAIFPSFTFYLCEDLIRVDFMLILEYTQTLRSAQI